MTFLIEDKAIVTGPEMIDLLFFGPYVEVADTRHNLEALATFIKENYVSLQLVM